MPVNFKQDELVTRDPGIDLKADHQSSPLTVLGAAWRVFWRYLLAVAVVAAAYMARVGLEAWTGPGLPTFVTFFPAVMLAALLGGVGSGVTATLLSALIVGLWIVPPAGEFSFANPVDEVALALFCGMGLFMTVVAELYRRNRVKKADIERAEALRESEGRLKLAAQAGGMGTWHLDVVTNRLDYSAEMLHILGIDRAQWGGTPEALEALVHPDDVEHRRRTRAAALASGERMQSEFRIRRPDGEVRWMHSRGTVLRAPDGRAVDAYGVMIDITERKKAEAALRESEEKFRGIFDNAATGIAISDLEGRFRSCNPAFAAMLGYTEVELRKLAFPELVHPDDREAKLTEIRRLLAEEIPSCEIVNRYVRKDGAPLWMHKHISLLRDAAGRPISIITLVTDISERKSHEEQVHLLLREVSHRAKNMLSVVQVIASQTAAADRDEFLEHFSQRIQALAANHDLLIMSQWQSVDLADLVRGQLAPFRDLIGKRIALEGPPLRVLPHATQTLAMALHELTTNAVKYGALSNSEGAVRITWTNGDDDAGRNSFHLRWTEHGGPEVHPPSRRGFGTTVLDRLPRASLAADIRLDFAPTGVTWNLACPVDRVLEGGTSQ